MPHDLDDLARRLAAGEWLRLGEVAALAGVPRTSLNAALRDGKVTIGSRKTVGGGQRRFDPADVRAFVAARARAAELARGNSTEPAVE